MSQPREPCVCLREYACLVLVTKRPVKGGGGHGTDATASCICPATHQRALAHGSSAPSTLSIDRPAVRPIPSCELPLSYQQKQTVRPCGLGLGREAGGGRQAAGGRRETGNGEANSGKRKRETRSEKRQIHITIRVWYKRSFCLASAGLFDLRATLVGHRVDGWKSQID